MPRFSGKVEHYSGFKNHFIVAVHRLPLPLFAKHMALRAILEQVAELESFVGTIEPGPDGYASMIWELEDRYGGKERLLHKHASNLKFLPTVTEDNLGNMEKFINCVQAYHAALGRDSEIESYHHFNELYYKLEYSLRIKYRTYCRTIRLSQSQESSALNLLDWIRYVVAAALRMDPRRGPRPPAPVRGGRDPPGGRKPLAGFSGLAEPSLGGGGADMGWSRAHPGESLEADCEVCQQGVHPLEQCPTFLERSIPDRKLLLFSLGGVSAAFTKDTQVAVVEELSAPTVVIAITR